MSWLMGGVELWHFFEDKDIMITPVAHVFKMTIKIIPLKSEICSLFVPTVVSLSFFVQNDVCADFDKWRLFLNSSAESGKFLRARWKFDFRRQVCQHVTWQCNYFGRQSCSSLKFIQCDADTWVASAPHTENSVYSEAGDMLCSAGKR